MTQVHIVSLARRSRSRGGTELVFGLFWAAQMYAMVGDVERAIGALERSHEMNDPNLLQYLRASPAMERLSARDRYRALLRELPY